MSESGLSAGEARSELYRVIREHSDFEAQSKAALELGKRYLGVDNGHITRIDPESDYWKTLVSTDPPDGDFPPGLILDLGTTYCRRTIEQEDALVVDDAPQQGWDGDPAFEKHGLHCYHGTNITLDEDTYGTVCFVAEDPRDEPFSPDETMFAELIGRLLERELERARAQRKIERLEEFADVVSHDVRNPLNVAQSAIDGLQTEHGNLSTAADALDRIETIIDSMLTVARQGRMVTETETLTLWSVGEQCWQRVATGDGSLTVEESMQFDADRGRANHLFENLFRNAVEHGSADGRPQTDDASEDSGEAVTVRIGTLDGREGFYVADDGPGIPAAQREMVFESGYTTGEQGTGLGLAIVESVASAHDWTVDVTESVDGGARFEISDVVVPQ
jgi:anti-sigma regulatory factor (Ser/Thr protein kinase)